MHCEERKVKSIYLIGSLRNPMVPEVGRRLREAGYDAFDSWFAAGPEADDYWLKYEKDKGVHFLDALYDYAAQHVFEFDLKHLQRCDAAILVLPAGKSGHLELGFMAGQGKPTFILFDKEPERWDVMYNFASMVYTDVNKLIEGLKFPGWWRGYHGAARDPLGFGLI
jgi:nucleoside 2-deoxyribosyltransferase